MGLGDAGGLRPVTAGMRRMLYLAAALVFGAGFPLLVFTEYTDKLFPWTIDPPLTAAFLGACYWSAGVLEWAAARERLWCRARVAVPGVLLFTILTCIPTVANLGHFNMRSPATYAWVAIYFGVPPVLGWLWWRQAAVRGEDEPRSLPLPGFMRAGYWALGGVLLASGAVLFAAPAAAAALWPWDLNPPDSRYAQLSRMEPYVGVWLLGLGTVAVNTVLENDFRRVRCVFAGGVALPALIGVAVLRYPGTVLWSRPTVAVFAVCLALLLGLSVAGLAKLRRESMKNASGKPDAFVS